MTVDHRPTAPRPPKGERRRVEEDCAWARLFLEIDQPAIAAELVKQLDKTTNADIRRDNFPLYVLAQQTLAKYKVAKEREQRAAGDRISASLLDDDLELASRVARNEDRLPVPVDSAPELRSRRFGAAGDVRLGDAPRIAIRGTRAA